MGNLYKCGGSSKPKHISMSIIEIHGDKYVDGTSDITKIALPKGVNKITIESVEFVNTTGTLEILTATDASGIGKTVLKTITSNSSNVVVSVPSIYQPGQPSIHLKYKVESTTPPKVILTNVTLEF